jgi:hypothetical protein
MENIHFNDPYVNSALDHQQKRSPDVSSHGIV